MLIVYSFSFVLLTFHFFVLAVIDVMWFVDSIIHLKKNGNPSFDFYDTMLQTEPMERWITGENNNGRERKIWSYNVWKADTKENDLRPIIVVHLPINHIHVTRSFSQHVCVCIKCCQSFLLSSFEALNILSYWFLGFEIFEDQIQINYLTFSIIWRISRAATLLIAAKGVCFS